MNLLQLARIGRRRRSEASRYSLEQYVADVQAFTYNGLGYTGGLTQTYSPSGKVLSERTDGHLESRVSSAYNSNGVVFACQVARLLLFSEARFQFQRLIGGQPGDLFGTESLVTLEEPWPNGSTGELLGRMIQDVDLAGNAFIRRTGPLSAPRLERLRPDLVSIVLGELPDLLTPQLAGYFYEPDGPGGRVIWMDISEVAHWSPIPDPLANYRGMSWLSPVLREIRGDNAFTNHKAVFMANAATPNMVIKFAADVGLEKLERFKALFETEHQGIANAYKTLFLGGGADATPVGHSFREMDFRAVQGAGETRIAAAAGVPPVIVGLSEGLEAATYSNYAQARRRFADMTIRPLWRSAAAALSPLIEVPSRSRLWYDDRDIPALKEDAADAANIQSIRAKTITSLIREGFTPESVVRAIDNDDFRLLVHTGMVSVQLQTPGAEPEPAEPAPTEEPLEEEAA